MPHDKPLSLRQQQVLEEAYTGNYLPIMAMHLESSETSVKEVLRRIYRKKGVANRSKLMALRITELEKENFKLREELRRNLKIERT